MSTLVPQLAGARAKADAGAPLDVGSVAIWLLAALIAVFFALIVRDSTVIDGIYLPRGNDSFYHARRILDAAVGDRGFYQFDDRIHVPDGAWIPWPWAYDYLMAKATQVALWVDPTLDPMVFIAYVPVAWIFVNAALFMAATGAIGLTREMRLLAMVCFALSPLTQLLHSIGMVDHHYIEHTFVLLTLWLGLRWLRQPGDAYRALAVGITLGVAPAFHTGLFILQLFTLTTVFVLWLRHATPPRAALLSFGAGLFVTTQLVLIPSEPYRFGVFEFGLLSWFHFYVAFCTALALAIMAWLPFSQRNLAILAAVSCAVSVPLGAQLTSGAGFLAADFSILDQIVEARSPYRLFTDTFGPTETASYYSWLLLLAPALLLYYGYRLLRDREPARVYYAVWVVFGLALLLAQLRLHYFGLFALVTGGLLVVNEMQARRGWHRGAAFVGTFAAIVLAYQPALRERLFIVYAPGADPEYASALAIFRDLETLCGTDPGVVLASSNDGNAILFHSDCSVIANNFILREADKKHIDEIDRLMELPSAEIRTERPDVKYVFLRARDFGVLQDDVANLVADSPIVKEFFIDAPPPGYTLVNTVHTHIGAEGAEGIYARLYKIERSGDGGG